MGRHYVGGVPPAAHSRRRNVGRAVLGLGLVALLIAGVVAIVSGRVVGACDSTESFSVMADPALAPAVRDRAAAASDRCTTYTVVEAPDSQAAGRLTVDGETPDLWVAPSQARASAVAAQVGRDFAPKQVAASPLVLAGSQIEQPASWYAALTSATIRAVPNDSTYSDAPVVAAISEAQKDGSNRQAITEALAQYAQAAPRLSGDVVPAAKAASGVVAVPEYAYLSAKKVDPTIAATVPKTGAARDDVMLAATATGNRATAAKAGAERLGQAFTSDDGQRALAAQGLRGTQLRPEPAGGVGTVSALPDPDKAQLDQAQQAFNLLAIPIKALVVVDTSGSMDERVGNTTRIGMLVSGFTKVVTKIPDANAVGLWSFSVSRGNRPDWTEVVPTGRLDSPRGDKTQRQALLDGVTSLPGRVGGGTGLYDTTLAAYRQAVRDFDPAFANSVILLSDGGNEKNGGINLEQLVAQLKRTMDPARPVNIHTVGITRDADMAALSRIADTTNGTAQSADTEEQMLNDFVNAVAKRAK